MTLDDAGDTVADLLLDDVRISVHENLAGSSMLHGSGMVSPGLAWDTDKGLLYIVHTDANRVSVIDLRQGTVLRSGEFAPLPADVREQVQSPPSRFNAHDGSSIYRLSTLSPGGSKIYVASRLFDMRSGGFQQTPLGLAVIRTSDLKEVGHLDLPPDHGIASRCALLALAWQCSCRTA